MASSEDEEPVFQISVRGWQRITGGFGVLAAAVLVALLSQTALWNRADHAGQKPDGLTTLALVLAVISFFIQVIVFFFQTQLASAAVRRSDQLARETSDVLTKIEATSDATKEVLFSQFDRLLDYVVGADRPPSENDADDVEVAEDVEDVATDAAPTEPVPAADAPLTRADLERVVRDLGLRAGTTRPSFSGTPAASPASPEDTQAAEFLKSFPPRDEAEAAVAQVSTLSLLATAMLTRLAGREIQTGKRVRIARPDEGGPALVIRELMDRGFVRYDDDEKTGRLTASGRAVARILPIGKTGPAPDWWGDVIEPLTHPPQNA